MSGWMNRKLESRFPGEISTTSFTQMTPSLWQKVKRNWKWKIRVKNLAENSTFKKRRSWHPVPSLHGKYMGKQWQTSFWGLQNHCWWWLQLAPWKKSCDKPRQHIKKKRHYFADKGPSSRSYGFANSHVWLWELDRKESWALKNWCFWTVVLEKTLESLWDCKEIQPVNPKGN